MEERESHARKIVTRYMWFSAGVGLLPWPLVDMAALIALQLRMLYVLSKRYDVPFDKDVGKKVVAALLGTVVPASLTSVVERLVKVVPVIGPLAGALAMPSFSGAATYAMGKVFIQHFEAGGTLLDFEPAKVREYFRQEFDKGRHLASEIRHA